ncbi:MAG: threonine synthase, partial [Pseudomonadota bacterium]
VYYYTSAVSLGAPGRRVDFCVPTGNFGDIFAGRIAQAMGLPVGRLVIATNRNDILHRTMVSGHHTKEGVAPTLSPAVAIEGSSNFERAVFDAYGRDGGAVAQLMAELSENGGFPVSQGAMEALRETYASGRSSEDETSEMIRTTFAETGEVLCPHSAVGVKVAREMLDPARPMVTLATAHPAMFPDAVEAATGRRPPLPNRMADLYERSERVTRVENSLAHVEELIEDRIAK